MEVTQCTSPLIDFVGLNTSDYTFRAQ